MKLGNALAMISGGAQGAAKTASAVPSAPAPASSSDAAAENLKQALKEATAIEPTATKTAGQAAPVEDLAKLAADVSSSEHEALVKEAQMYGASVADGFVARLAQYEAAATKVASTGIAPAPVTKTAGADDGFEKFAAENPDLVREAHDLGYEKTRTELTKLAEAAYVHGYNSTVEQIHKHASDSFVAGFSDTLKLIEAANR